MKTTLAGSNLTALFKAPETAKPLFVLVHGAGADLESQHMTRIADVLAESGIGTLRYNFPYMQEGKKRVDKKEVCLDTIRLAVDHAAELCPDATCILAGHSFGGRMSSHYMAEENDARCRGLVYFSFPLHAPRKPDSRRAAHLADITVPMLFLSGDRDDLAEPSLLKAAVNPLPNATLHWLETANHSFKILKRTRQNPQDVYEEAAGVIRDWLGEL